MVKLSLIRNTAGDVKVIKEKREPDMKYAPEWVWCFDLKKSRIDGHAYMSSSLDALHKLEQGIELCSKSSAVVDNELKGKLINLKNWIDKEDSSVLLKICC